MHQSAKKVSIIPYIEIELKVMIALPIKKVIFLAGFLALSGNIFAQNADSLLNDFGNSILKKMHYPNELVSRCTPTFTVLKITVDKEGEIANMQLSDSADPLFVVEWLSKKKLIDLSSLKKYIKKYSIASTEVLLPINYTFSNRSCSTMNIDQANCLRLFLFENSPAKGNFYVLPPLNLFRKITMSY